MSLSIKELLSGSFLSKKTEVFCWIKSVQIHPNITFIKANDGSTTKNLQVVYKKGDLDVSKLNVGAGIRVEGIMVESVGSDQPYELKAEVVEVLAECSEDYPIQKKNLSLEYLRSMSHMRHRTQSFHAITLIKNETLYAIYQYFYQAKFIQFHPPIFTTNSCEGGSDVFELSKEGNEFFKTQTLLSVSGQFYAEALALGLKNVYILAPTFRAEKSNSSHHLAEFWMLEIEMSFAKLADLMSVTEEFIKFVTKHVLDNCKDELMVLQELLPDNEGLIAKLEAVVANEFVRLDYADAIKTLQEHVAEKKVDFINQDIEFGMNLSSEHERYLSEKVFSSPVFVVNYPKAIKAFYMKQNDDNVTVGAMDLLFPGVGELIGGSERETDVAKIEAHAKALGVNLDEQQWYLELRKYGYHLSSGFGLGLERLIMYYTGIKNIKDASTFPRSYQQINF